MVTDQARVVPQGPPRIDVAANGAVIAIAEPERVSIAGVPDLSLRAEIGIDPDANACEVSFIGRQLLISSRYASHTLLYLIDPEGPQKLAELRVELGLYILAKSGDRVLATSNGGTVVISATDDRIEVARLPLRSEPSSAAGLGNGQFILNVGGGFEEWDGRTRAPLRRFKLSRPQSIRMLGYGVQNLWWVTSADPTHLEVLPVSGRAQARVCVLPEPVSRVVGHPDVDAVLAIGTESRRVYVVDIGSGKQVTKLDDVAGDVALVADRKASAVIVAQGRPAIVRAIVAHVKQSVAEEPAAEPEAPAPMPSSAPAPAAKAETKQAVPAPVAASSDTSVAKRLNEWREKMYEATKTDGARVTEQPAADAPTWRDELVTWGRLVANGLHRDASPKPSPVMKTALNRLGIDGDLGRAVAFAYAMHLCGTTIAPAELANLLRRRWDEALGRGVLGATGVLRWRNSRISLAPALAAFLDERGPVTGDLVGIPRDQVEPMEPGAIVAPGLELDIVAGRCTDLAGAVLVPRRYASTSAIRIDAKLRVAVPIVEVTRDFADLETAFVRVESADQASARGLPVIADFSR